MKETVEEFMARGGKINHIPMGQGSGQIRLTVSKSSKLRHVHVKSSKTTVFNNNLREKDE